METREALLSLARRRRVTRLPARHDENGGKKQNGGKRFREKTDVPAQITPMSQRRFLRRDPARYGRYVARHLNALDDYVPEAVLLAVTAISTLAIVYRYFLNNPLGWTDELGRFLFVWMVFIGAAAVLKRGGHFNIDVMTRLSGWWYRTILLFRELVGLTVGVALVWYGREFADLGKLSSTATLELSSALVYIAVPIGGVLYCLRTIVRIYQVISGGRLMEPESAVDEA